jgi:hypothetical protein
MLHTVTAQAFEDTTPQSYGADNLGSLMPQALHLTPGTLFNL